MARRSAADIADAHIAVSGFGAKPSRRGRQGHLGNRSRDRRDGRPGRSYHTHTVGGGAAGDGSGDDSSGDHVEPTDTSLTPSEGDDDRTILGHNRSRRRGRSGSPASSGRLRHPLCDLLNEASCCGPVDDFLPKSLQRRAVSLLESRRAQCAMLACVAVSVTFTMFVVVPSINNAVFSWQDRVHATIQDLQSEGWYVETSMGKGAKRGRAPPNPGWNWQSLPSSTRELYDSEHHVVRTGIDSAPVASTAVAGSMMSVSGPWQDPLEVGISRLFLDRSSRVVEFGSGRSTLYYAQFVDAYAAVESDMAWCSAVKEDVRERGYTHTEVRCVPPDVAAGTAEFDASPDRVRYASYIHDFESCCVGFRAPEQADVIIDDGNARLEIASLASAMVDSDTVLLIHDYARPEYKALLADYDLLATNHASLQKGGGQIAALRRKRRFAEGTRLNDDFFGTGDFGRAVAGAQGQLMQGQGQEHVLAGGGPARTPVGWNAFSVAREVRCLTDTYGTKWMRPLDVALVKSFVRHDGSMVVIGGSPAVIYFARLVYRLAVYEWRPAVCEWLDAALADAGLEHVEVWCIRAPGDGGTPRVRADTDAATVITGSMRDCCTGFDALNTEVVLVSNLLTREARNVVARFLGDNAHPRTRVVLPDWGADAGDRALTDKDQLLFAVASTGPSADGAADGIAVLAPIGHGATYQHDRWVALPQPPAADPARRATKGAAAMCENV